MLQVRSAIRSLSTKLAMFKAFDHLTQRQEEETRAAVGRYVATRAAQPAPHPAIAAFDALDKQVRQVEGEVFKGRNAITEQALLLRLTGEALQRCVTGRGSVDDYIALIVALALIMLIPALAVAAKLVRQEAWASQFTEPDICDEIERTRREADLYGDLTQARHQRGQAKMRATVAEGGWDEHIAAQQRMNRWGAGSAPQDSQ